jgi:hypothetical protein
MSEADKMFEELGYKKTLTMMVGIKEFFEYIKTDEERNRMAN